MASSRSNSQANQTQQTSTADYRVAADGESIVAGAGASLTVDSSQESFEFEDNSDQSTNVDFDDSSDRSVDNSTRFEDNSDHSDRSDRRVDNSVQIDDSSDRSTSIDARDQSDRSDRSDRRVDNSVQIDDDSDNSTSLGAGAIVAGEGSTVRVESFDRDFATEALSIAAAISEGGLDASRASFMDAGETVRESNRLTLSAVETLNADALATARAFSGDSRGLAESVLTAAGEFVSSDREAAKAERLANLEFARSSIAELATANRDPSERIAGVVTSALKWPVIIGAIVLGLLGLVFFGGKK